jgi:pulcherriminic acid synthase
MLAKTELDIGIAQLLDTMRDIRFAGRTPPPEHGVYTRAPASLPLVFTQAG